MLLLTLADQLKSSMQLELTAIHVHHGLSPNADAWAAFVPMFATQKKFR